MTELCGHFPREISENGHGRTFSSSLPQHLTMNAMTTTLHVIVPYRDRPSQLAVFLPHMAAYFDRNGIADHVLWIVEQSDDDRPFNRGAVRNAGLREVLAANGADERCVVCFHDVDTLPLVDGLPYGAPEPPFVVTHLYGHTHCLGGVLCAHAGAIERASGYPNSLWGWGREDALLEERVKRSAGGDAAIDRRRLCERWVTGDFVEVPDDVDAAAWSPPRAGDEARAAALLGKKAFMALFQRRVLSGEYGRVASRAKQLAASDVDGAAADESADTAAGDDGLRGLQYRVMRNEAGEGDRVRRVVVELLIVEDEDGARDDGRSGSGGGAEAAEVAVEVEPSEESLD